LRIAKDRCQKWDVWVRGLFGPIRSESATPAKAIVISTTYLLCPTRNENDFGSCKLVVRRMSWLWLVIKHFMSVARVIPRHLILHQ
jgi:hypothetical protein